MLLCNLDGVITPEASISVLDRGFLYGDSVYEVIRTYRGIPFALPEHLARLRASAAYLYMRLPWSDEYITQEVQRTLAAAPTGEYYIRIVVTRGGDRRIGLLPEPTTQPRLLIVLMGIPPEPTLSEQGIRLAIPKRQRTSTAALDPAAKTGNYLNNILALLEAQQAGFEDALLLNAQGQITEATTSNFWIVRGGVVETPPTTVGMLHGITRGTLLQIVADLGIPHREVILTPQDLAGASEGFLSSSVRLLMPIRQVNEVIFPACPGPVTQQLWRELLAVMEKAVAAA
ncbi:branched-chain amino acid aminotransferase [Thermostichus vulcanus NIES-2134]|nr:branched-chain amino acid aminotransferase [Thermostichus vulcanus NIES-2134]